MIKTLKRISLGLMLSLIFFGAFVFLFYVCNELGLIEISFDKDLYLKLLIVTVSTSIFGAFRRW